MDRLIRPIVHEGFADHGVEISMDTVEPEPGLTADGAWWQLAAVINDHHLQVLESPLLYPTSTTSWQCAEAGQFFAAPQSY